MYRMCCAAQENPDDFESGPLYLLTQSVKENSQVRRRRRPAPAQLPPRHD
jgi:hypothetical protein